VFLATATYLRNIPSALLDRMELVQIDGYTEDDKVAIGRLPAARQRDRAALHGRGDHGDRGCAAQDAADYTREKACGSSSGCWPSAAA